MAHGLVQDAALGTVALIHKDVDVAFGLEVRRKGLRELLHILFSGLLANLLVFRCVVACGIVAKLMNQRSDEPRGRIVQFTEQIDATGSVIEGILLVLVQQTTVTKTVGNLFVQFVTVGNDDNSGILDVLLDPLSQPDHSEGFAGALGVPYDTAVLCLDTRYGRLKSKELIRTGNLLRATVIDDAVMDEVKEALGLQHLEDGTVQLVHNIGEGGLVLFRIAAFTGGLLPAEVILFRGAGGSVPKAFTGVASHHELGSGEETRNVTVLLVTVVLTDGLGHRDAGAFEFENDKGDTVDVHNDVRTAMLGISHAIGLDRDLFCQFKDVLFRVLPVYEADSLVYLARALGYADTVAETVVNVLAGLHQSVEGTAGVNLFLEFANGSTSLVLGQFLLTTCIRGEPGSDGVFTKVGVLFFVEIADVSVERKSLPDERDDVILRRAL